MKRYMVLAAVGAMLAMGCAHQKEEKHEKISLTAAPAAVKEGFAREFPGATIRQIQKETYADGTVHYEVEYRDEDGKAQEVEFTADGERLDEH